MTIFQVFVSYSQISVFDPSLSEPFNNWTSRHVAQGFAWRPGSASFKTISESGRHNVEVFSDAKETPMSPDAIRIVEVPFLVPSNGSIDVASISDSHQLRLPPGPYQLRFEASRGSKIKLVFTDCRKPRFAVLRADADLAPTMPLLETAEPA
ncbi:MAG: competence protein ComJ [Xanthobacteraceae bacterium]